MTTEKSGNNVVDTQERPTSKQVVRGTFKLGTNRVIPFPFEIGLS